MAVEHAHGETRQRIAPVAANAIAMWACSIAIVAHFGAGWLDERRLVLRPVGHLTVLLVPLWGLVALTGAAAVEFNLRRPVLGIVTIAIAGLAALGIITV